MSLKEYEELDQQTLRVLILQERHSELRKEVESMQKAVDENDVGNLAELMSLKSSIVSKKDLMTRI